MSNKNTRKWLGLTVVPAMLLSVLVFLPCKTSWGQFSSCDNACCECGCVKSKPPVYGWKGQPWSDPSCDRCRCGKRCARDLINSSYHWPSPWSAMADYGLNGRQLRSSAFTNRPHFRDNLDLLSNIRLLPPVRNDNGYCGPDCDPYGIPGRSQNAYAQFQHTQPNPVPPGSRLNPEALPNPDRYPLFPENIQPQANSQPDQPARHPLARIQSPTPEKKVRR